MTGSLDFELSGGHAGTLHISTLRGFFFFESPWASSIMFAWFLGLGMHIFLDSSVSIPIGGILNYE